MNRESTKSTTSTDEKCHLLNQKGATMLEYALLAALISAAAISSISFLGIQAKKTTQLVSCNICMTHRYPWYSQKERYCKIITEASYDGYVCKGR